MYLKAFISLQKDIIMVAQFLVFLTIHIQNTGPGRQIADVICSFEWLASNFEDAIISGCRDSIINIKRIRRMVDFTFAGLFGTTSKGIPDTTRLPTSTTMTHSYYLNSLLLQATLLLFFVFYFVLSVYRVIKKIKNKNFKEIPQDEKKEEHEPQKNEDEAKNQLEPSAKEDNLIYRFDDDDEEEEEKKDEKEENHEGELPEKEVEQKTKQEQKSQKEETPEEDYNDYHDANQQSFITLDEKLLFLQPFLISFIVANNLFEADLLVISCLVLMLVTYFLINVKGFLRHLRLAPMLFMLFPLVPYFSYFRGDHDLST